MSVKMLRLLVKMLRFVVKMRRFAVHMLSFSESINMITFFFVLEHAKMLTELLLDSNPLKDKSIKALTEYVASNPPCLRVLRFKNLYHDVTTPVIGGFLDALDTNSQLVKVVMDTRFYQQRDRLQRALDRNWKRYAQERRLKKTMLTQIQHRKQKSANNMEPENVGK